MRENTNDVSMNGENVETTASPEKKKERDGLNSVQTPEWMLDKTTVNELKFCKLFTQKHPMKCIGGRFFDYDGLVDENALGAEVYRMLRQGVWIGLSKKVVQIMDALRLYTYSAPLTPDLNFIHVQNGKLDLNGNFYPHREFCTNRLNICYDPNIRKGAYYPEKFLTFLMELLTPKECFVNNFTIATQQIIAHNHTNETTLCSPLNELLKILLK